MAFGSKRAPLAVRFPAKRSPYHDAPPHSRAIVSVLNAAIATAPATSTNHPRWRILKSPVKFLFPLTVSVTPLCRCERSDATQPDARGPDCLSPLSFAMTAAERS